MRYISIDKDKDLKKMNCKWGGNWDMYIEVKCAE